MTIQEANAELRKLAEKLAPKATNKSVTKKPAKKTGKLCGKVKFVKLTKPARKNKAGTVTIRKSFRELLT